MSANNIISAFRAAGLIPFNWRQVLVRMPNFQETDRESDHESEYDLTPDVVGHQDYPFACVPATPLRVDLAILREANVVLLTISSPESSILPHALVFRHSRSSHRHSL